MKVLKKHIELLLVQLALVASVQAQNLNFSQYYYTPFLTNPALIAKGNALQLNLGYRQQRSFSGQKYSTPMLSAIVPFLQSKTTTRRAAVGLSVVRDQEGEFLVNQGGMLSLAYNIQLGTLKGYPMQLSLGVQGGFFARRLDLNGFVTSSQITKGVIDNTAATGESFQNSNANILSFASGLYWHITDTDGLPVMFLGVAGHNINEPKGSFLSTSANQSIQMARRLNLIAGYRVFRTNNLSLTPTVQLENLNENLLRGGAWLRYHFGGEQGQLVKAGNVGAGVWYNTNGSATASLELNQPAFFVAISYDMAFANDSRAWQSGSPEIHLGIRKVLHTSTAKEKDRDKDGVPDKADECPKIAGPATTNGCPDGDGDGVADKNDVCPNIAGVAKFNGCPDTDGDGIRDSEDKCPQVAGVAQFNGCPDTDGDGIQDSEDKCPQVAGVARFNGCPDTDGDGVADKDDRCPQIAGLPAYKGCPDTDKDGVPDIDDACPQVAGSKTNKGCPVVDTPTKQRLNKLSIEIRDQAFGYRKSEINPNMIPKLNKLMQELKKNPNITIKVIGHTDHLGEENFNKKLSLQRAQAVEKYLRDKGVTHKIIVKGEGEGKPIAPNTTEAGRRKNRRIDIEFIYEK